ncbi:Glycosyl hydrolase family 98 putative carbohydrate binding module [Hymenobacter roseosalivarius DSM 11622]|uniref:Glycosyl hydrolase family 98 putative carbohydrate binding module n=1 Tax=Hymenobacter roseosalivarius DSM 11622 TaxID=645990 RepID=A0A1W1W627_9BACT|nr:NPCBM/NEW2 domain-containing protein [Hymenobacter roseosalivarius]SMC00564.1 Glycosyl hydrolase family 98 putative carbohydrate binding module [Hymenobacter roseosalivarius DSM 11622]
MAQTPTPAALPDSARDPALASEKEAAWSSGLITRQTPGHSKTVDVDIQGAKKLYLNVRNGGGDIAWDHANWLEPTLTNGQKSIALSSLSWKQASAGWGKATVNKSVSGAELLVGGKKYTHGIGTHSNFLIEYELPAGFTRFKATVRLDNAGAAQNTGGTVQFLVFTKNPFKPVPADSVRVEVALQQLGFNSACTIRNLWTGKEVGTFTGKFAPPHVRRHGGKLYRVSAQRNVR